MEAFSIFSIYLVKLWHVICDTLLLLPQNRVFFLILGLVFKFFPKDFLDILSMFDKNKQMCVGNTTRHLFITKKSVTKLVSFPNRIFHGKILEEKMNIVWWKGIDMKFNSRVKRTFRKEFNGKCKISLLLSIENDQNKGLQTVSVKGSGTNKTVICLIFKYRRIERQNVFEIYNIQFQK